MLKRTGTKQRSDDRTTNLSRLIIIGNLRIDLFSVATVRGKNVWWGNQWILSVDSVLSVWEEEIGTITQQISCILASTTTVAAPGERAVRQYNATSPLLLLPHAPPAARSHHHAPQQHHSTQVGGTTSHHTTTKQKTRKPQHRPAHTGFVPLVYSYGKLIKQHLLQGYLLNPSAGLYSMGQPPLLW